MKAKIETLYKESQRKLIADEARGNCFAYVSVDVSRWSSRYMYNNIYLILLEAGYVRSTSGTYFPMTRYGQEYKKTAITFYSSQLPGGEDDDEWAGPVKIAQKELASEMNLLLQNVEKLGLSWEGPCGPEDIH